jgi:hypothetical protein
LLQENLASTVDVELNTLITSRPFAKVGQRTVLVSLPIQTCVTA